MVFDSVVKDSNGVDTPTGTANQRNPWLLRLALEFLFDQRSGVRCPEVHGAFLAVPLKHRIGRQEPLNRSVARSCLKEGHEGCAIPSRQVQPGWFPIRRHGKWFSKGTHKSNFPRVAPA